MSEERHTVGGTRENGGRVWTVSYVWVVIQLNCLGTKFLILSKGLDRDEWMVRKEKAQERKTGVG